MFGGGSDNMLVSLLPFILIFVIMYFLILRPQQKRQKQHADMVKNVRRGDTVVTSGGLVGKVTKVIDDEQVEVELADGVRVLSRVLRRARAVLGEGASLGKALFRTRPGRSGLGGRRVDGDLDGRLRPHRCRLRRTDRACCRIRQRLERPRPRRARCQRPARRWRRARRRPRAYGRDSDRRRPDRSTRRRRRR